MYICQSYLSLQVVLISDNFSCFCLQVESVELALKILDGYEVRGNKIHVERAKFTMKGNFDPSKKRKKLTNKEKKRLKEKQQK